MKKWILLLAALSMCAACGQKSSTPAKDPGDEESSEELIIGGRAVTKKNEIALTTVSLVDTREGALCTASILSEEVALTAAHCVEGQPEDMQISFGPRTSGRETRPVVDVAASPVWALHQRERMNNGDIALVRFSGGLPAGARPATLMKAGHRLSNGEIVTLAGFGITSGHADGDDAGRLRAVDVKIDNAQYSKTEVSIDQTNRKGACHGDSGGPAFVQDNGGGLLLWGVTSRGINDPSDRCAGDSVYTRIQPYARWINNVLRSWGVRQKSRPVE
jgi:hypothetical protein